MNIKKEQDKVYCRDCKWFCMSKKNRSSYCKVGRSSLFIRGNSLIDKDYRGSGRNKYATPQFKNEEIYTKYFNEYLRRDIEDTRQRANIEGDCPFYIRKWWKFWVKIKDNKNIKLELIKDEG